MTAPRIGSLFAGIGGLDLACEWAGLGSTAWQLDLTGADVRRRHWPGALQVEADVTTVDPLDLPRVDVLCGGFPCQDLSVAGSGRGLDGERSGLYREVVRFARVLRPGMVVIENVPGLLRPDRRAVLDADLAALGYGVTWVRARALDAGTPHLRARVFALAVLGGAHGDVLEAPRDGAWVPGPGPTRPWPTPTVGDAKASGNRSLATSDAHAGTSLTDAVRPDRAVAEGPWPTPSTRDYKVGSGLDRVGTPPLSEVAAPTGGLGRRLNPAWVESLMGYPEGWTLPEGVRLDADPAPRWPRGRYPADWDRSQVWPGYDWEAPRTLPDGPPTPGRPARLRALGNAVVPQQGALALRQAVKHLLGDK